LIGIYNWISQCRCGIGGALAAEYGAGRLRDEEGVRGEDLRLQARATGSLGAGAGGSATGYYRLYDPKDGISGIVPVEAVRVGDGLFT
jgi:hypothetical protein